MLLGHYVNQRISSIDRLRCQVKLYIKTIIIILHVHAGISLAVLMDRAEKVQDDCNKALQQICSDCSGIQINYFFPADF